MIERDYNLLLSVNPSGFQRSHLDTYKNTVWFIFNTVGTIGYGDVICESNLGKMVGLLICVTGPIMISILVVEILRFFIFEESQQFSFDLFERLEAKERIRVGAARILQLLFRRRKLKKMLSLFLQRNQKGFSQRYKSQMFFPNKVYPLPHSKTVAITTPGHTQLEDYRPYEKRI